MKNCYFETLLLSALVLLAANYVTADTASIVGAVDTVKTVGTGDKARNRVGINEFIRAYALQESKDVVIDPRVKGNVTLLSEYTPGEITKDEFYTVLLTHGYGGYQEDNLIVVAQQVLTKQRNIPNYNGKSRGNISAHETVTTVIKIKRRDAGELEILFRPLIEQWGYIRADEATNSILLVTTLGNAERIHRLAKAFDTKPVEL